MGSSKQTTNTRSTTRPVNNLGGSGLKSALGMAENFASDVNNFVPTYSDTTQNYLNRAEQFANAPAAVSQYMRPVVEAGTGGFGDAISGLRQTATMDPAANPYLDAIIAQRNREIGDDMAGRFSAAGRYGSGAMGSTMGTALADASDRLRYQDFYNQQGRMDNAQRALAGYGIQTAGMAGNLDQGESNKIALQGGVGQVRDAMLAADRMAPAQQAEWLQNMSLPSAQAFSNRNQTSTSKSTPSVGQQIIGGATTALGLMSGMPSLGMGGGLMSGLMGGATYGAAPEMMGAMGMQPYLNNKPLYGPF
jgi:hypothetical protein